SGKGARTGDWRLGRWRVPVFIFTLLYALVAVILPFAQLLLVAFAPYFGWVPTSFAQAFNPETGFTFTWFAQLLGDPTYIATFTRTAGVAALAAAIGVIAVIIILWAVRLRRGRIATLLDSSQMLP